MDGKLGRAVFRSFAAGLVVVAAASAAAEETKLQAILTSSDVVPPADSAATGWAELVFESNTMEVFWIISYAGLSGQLTSVTLHGPGEPGENAPQVVRLIGDLSDPILGGSTMSATNAGYLLDGTLYIVISSTAFPEGELRGQFVVAGSVPSDGGEDD